jgi:hypothetical protein
MISDRMKKADEEQQCYPKLSTIYPPSKFGQFYCANMCDMQTIKLQILQKQHQQLLQDYNAVKLELDQVKQDFINELLRTSKL